MIKDIHKIRQELEGFVEVSHDYEFKPNIWIKYYTRKNDEMGFFIGGKFKFRGNNSLMLERQQATWPVRIHHLNPDGSTQFTARFFIKESEEPEPDKEVAKIKGLTETILYQQHIIETMTETLKSLEIQKHQIASDKSDYEELLEQNRHHLKDLSVKSREIQRENEQYREIIQKLSQSHPMMR
jgi:mevalonate kinase